MSLQSKSKKKLPMNKLPDDSIFKDAVQLLEGKLQLLDEVLDSMGDGLSIQDRNMRIVYQNKYMIDNFGEHIGDYCYKIYENRDKPCNCCPIIEAYNTGEVSRSLRVGITSKGEKFRFENIASLLRNDKKEIIAGMEIVRLVEDREQALDELRASAAKLMQAKAVYENSSEGIIVIDKNDCVVSVNPAFEEITGYKADDVIGMKQNIFNPEGHTHAEMWDYLRKVGSWKGEISTQHKDGHICIFSVSIDTIKGDNSEVLQRVCVFSDITEKKQVQRKIEHMALHDSLTNLPNRALYEDRLRQAIAKVNREKSFLALLYIDLDRFKIVNDTFGHITGDTLLQLVANRICNCLREMDTAARLGGDEFAVIAQNIRNKNEAFIVAEKIRNLLEQPFNADNVKLNISCSIGVAFYSGSEVDDGEVLIQKADQAMYLAKSEGRNRVCMWGK